MLTKFLLEPFANVLVDDDINVKKILEEIWMEKPIAPSKYNLERFALESLDVKSEQLEIWYRSAWWGFHATRILLGCERSGKLESITHLVQNQHAWRTLDSALYAGNGAILLTTHLGPGHVPSCAAKAKGYRIKTIARTKYDYRLSNSDDFIFVTSKSERKSSLLKALKHLKSGGIVSAAPTGQIGDSYKEINFLGHSMRVFPGIWELIRLSESPVFWASCSWGATGNLRLIIEPISYVNNSKAELNTYYMDRYFQLLKEQMKCNPADLGFRGGFWEYIPWYQP